MYKKRKFKKNTKVKVIQKIKKRIQKVNTPEGLEISKYVNTHKFTCTESEILLDFGHATYKDDEMHIEVASRLAVSPDDLRNLILSLFQIGVEYQKKYKKSIGFDTGKSNDKDKGKTP